MIEQSSNMMNYLMDYLHGSHFHPLHQRHAINHSLIHILLLKVCALSIKFVGDLFSKN